MSSPNKKNLFYRLAEQQESDVPEDIVEEEVIEEPVEEEIEEPETKKNGFFQDLLEKEDIEEKPQKNMFYKLANEEKAKDKGIWQPLYDFVFSEDPSKTFMGTEGSFSKTMRSVLPALGGKPGDIIRLVDTVSEKLSDVLPEVPEFLKGKEGLRKEARTALKSIPNTEELKDMWDQYTEGKDLPQNDKERVLDEIGTDLAQLIGGAKTFPKLLRTLSGTIAGNLAKEGLKNAEFGEGAQAAGKIGTMLFMSAYNPRSVKSFYDSKFKSAFKNLPEKELINAKPLSKNLTSLESEFKQGLKDIPSKESIFSVIKDLKRNIKKGEVNVKNLVEAKYNINELRDSIVYDPSKNYSKAVRGRLKRNFGKVSEAIDNTLEEYGKTNPAFYNDYKDAMQAFTGMQQSKGASRAIVRAIKDFKLASTTSGLLGLTYVPGYTTAGAAAGFSALKAFEMGHRALMNPTIRKHYLNTMKSALEDNKSAIIRNVKFLDSVLK